MAHTTPREVIAHARYLVNDRDLAGLRQDNDELVEYVNAGLCEMAILQPSLFSTNGQFTCVQGVQQKLNNLTALVLFEVLGVSNGPALTIFDFDAMNSLNRGWRTDPPGEAEQYTKLANDPLGFYIYPAAPNGQLLDIRYARVPQTYTIDQPITDIPMIYKSALADYVVHRAEAKDDEHVLSERSAAHYQAFVSKVKG